MGQCALAEIAGLALLLAGNNRNAILAGVEDIRRALLDAQPAAIAAICEHKFNHDATFSRLVCNTGLRRMAISSTPLAMTCWNWLGSSVP